MKPVIYNNTKTLTEIDLLIEEIITENKKLILYNDDVNTFDWVIDCLVEICNHDYIQAEQCAFIVHHKGKCSVREGTYNKLEPMASALLNRGLSVNIE